MFPQFKDAVTHTSQRSSSATASGAASERLAQSELLAWLFNESPVKDDVVINDRWGRGRGIITAGTGRLNIPRA
jgi:alpha-L-fucosidase